MAKQRYDSVRVKAHFDENGFLVDNPIVARIGLQIYKTAKGGERREFRPASEVFKPDSLASFQGKPVTLGHVVVNSKNAKDHVVGSCSGAGIPDGIGVQVPLVVYDEKAISKAKQKIAAELSVGYTSEDIERSGWGNNETGEYFFDDEKPDFKPDGDEWVKFDALQTNITVNHVALVFRGRAGVAKLNLDSEQEIPYIDDSKANKEDEKMKVVKIDGVDVEVPEVAAAHIAKLDSANTTAQTTITTLTVERDNLKAKVDGIDDLVKAAVEKAKADEADKASVIAFATECGVKTDGLELKDVKVAVIKALSNVDASEKDDAYIDMAYDFARNSDKMAANRVTVEGKEKDKSGKSDSADEIPDPQARFRK